MLNVSLISAMAVVLYPCDICIGIDLVKGEPPGVTIGVPERRRGRGPW